MAIYARSTVGPIRWEATDLRGSFEAEVANQSLDPSVAPSGRLELTLERLTSGNRVYDAELMRRLDARRYPIASAELRFLDAAGHQNRYQVHGDLTLHGVTRTIIGALAVDVDGKSVVRIYGDKVVDIRDFNIPSPTMLMLRIFPDVRVRISLVAETEAMTVDSEGED